jgi:hypothetical protein
VNVIRFDHLKLVRRHPTELRRFRSWLLSARPGNLEQVVIEHEANNACCRKEAWNDTAASIITALEPPTPQLLINMNEPEGATL